jgi:hypothetical protein
MQIGNQLLQNREFACGETGKPLSGADKADSQIPFSRFLQVTSFEATPRYLDEQAMNKPQKWCKRCGQV